MQQKQVGNFFKEKLDPKELTPSCLSQELSRFPGFFLYLSLNVSCNFILIQMVLTPHPRRRRERRKQEELLSSPSTPGWTGAQGQLARHGRPGRALRVSERSQILVDLPHRQRKETTYPQLTPSRRLSFSAHLQMWTQVLSKENTHRRAQKQDAVEEQG